MAGYGVRNGSIISTKFKSNSFLPRRLDGVVCALARATVALLQDRLASLADDLLSDVVLVLGDAVQLRRIHLPSAMARAVLPHKDIAALDGEAAAGGG